METYRPEVYVTLNVRQIGMFNFGPKKRSKNVKKIRKTTFGVFEWIWEIFPLDSSRNRKFLDLFDTSGDEIICFCDCLNPSKRCPKWYILGGGKCFFRKKLN